LGIPSHTDVEPEASEMISDVAPNAGGRVFGQSVILTQLLVDGQQTNPSEQVFGMREANAPIEHVL
jgi:hypothetical protein